MLLSILAIISSNVDPATQEILKLAKEADLEMKRTMAVLTKPDLNIERTTQQIAIDYVTGKRSDLTLGYYIVKNRGPDDVEMTLADGQQAERLFFASEPWSACNAVKRSGVDALKLRVRELLTELIKKEFPKLRMDISKSLSDMRSQRDKLGKARNEPESQMEYLCDLSDEFQAMARHGLSADYSSPEMLFKRSSLRLLTRVVEINELFSKEMSTAGHTRDFGDAKSGAEDGNLTPPCESPITVASVASDGESNGFEHLGRLPRSPASAKPRSSVSLEERLGTCTTLYPDGEVYKAYPELEKYCDYGWQLSYPKGSESIHEYIESIYSLSRGRDMGNVRYICCLFLLLKAKFYL